MSSDKDHHGLEDDARRSNAEQLHTGEEFEQRNRQTNEVDKVAPFLFDSLRCAFPEVFIVLLNFYDI